MSRALSRAPSPGRHLGAMLAVVATVPDEIVGEAPRRRLDRAVADPAGSVARDPTFPIDRLHAAPRPPP